MFSRSITSSVTSGDERWIRTVLKDLHPVLTQRVSERAEWTPITTEETSTASTRQNLRRDMSYERLMESGLFSIMGDHEGHKQRLPTPILDHISDRRSHFSGSHTRRRSFTVIRYVLYSVHALSIAFTSSVHSASKCLGSIGSG